MQLYRLDPVLLIRGPRAPDRRPAQAVDGSVRLATCSRSISAAILASGQLVLMGAPGQGVRVLAWPSESHLRPVAMALKPSGKRLLIVTAVGWLVNVAVRDLLATPLDKCRNATDEAVIGVPATQKADAISWAAHSKPSLWKHGNVSAVSWGPPGHRTALIFTGDGSFLAARIPRGDLPRLSDSTPYVWCEEVLTSRLPRIVLSAAPVQNSEGFALLLETTAPPPATGSMYYQLPLVPEGTTLKTGAPLSLSKPGALVTLQELRLSPVMVASDQGGMLFPHFSMLFSFKARKVFDVRLINLGKVNVWPTTRARSPLYTYNLPPAMQAVLLAGRIIFGVYEGKVLVLSAHHASAPAPTKPLQEIALPSGAKLLSASVVGNQSCALLWTTHGAFLCSPHTPPRSLFFHLLADPRSRAAADTLATALGMDLASMYEEAAERAMAQGEAGLAVELYYESDVRPAKLVARYMAIRKADVAISFLAAALRRPASLPLPQLRHMATVLLQCHAYVALASQAGIPSELASAPMADEACVEWAATSRDFDVGAALVLLRRAGLPRPFAAAARASCLTARALSAARGARLGRLLHALAQIEQVPSVQNNRLAVLLSQSLSIQSVARLRLLLPRLCASDLTAARKFLLTCALPNATDVLVDISLLLKEENPALPLTNPTIPASAANRAAGAGNRALASSLYQKKGDLLASAAALMRPTPPSLAAVFTAVSNAPVEAQATVLLRAMKAGVATEQEISQNLNAVAPALLLLLRSATPLPIRLSGRLCLRAMQMRIRAPRTDAAAVLPARLWQAVASNAAEEASAPPRGPISIPIYSLPQGALSSDPAIAFSCGHVYTRRTLTDYLSSKPPPVSPLFAGFYALRKIPLACPRCVAGQPSTK